MHAREQKSKIGIMDLEEGMPILWISNFSPLIPAFHLSNIPSSSASLQ